MHKNTVTISTESDCKISTSSINHKFNVNGCEGFITVGLNDAGRPVELFIVMMNEGSSICELYNVNALLISMSLQFGIPLAEIVRKLVGRRFEPCGPTYDPDIPRVSSVIDYIARWMGQEFVPGFKDWPENDTVRAAPIDARSVSIS